MWDLLDRRLKLTIVISLTLFFKWLGDGLFFWWNGTHLADYKIVSLIAVIIGTGLLIVANYAWRWLWKVCPKLEIWVFPDLNGIWTGTLVSTWINPQTGKGVPPIPTTIRIEQSLMSFHLHLKTGESESHSTRWFLEQDKVAGKARIWYYYQNRPQAQFNYRSSKHDGAAWLELDLRSNERVLQGQYFTERRTGGDIKVSYQKP